MGDVCCIIAKGESCLRKYSDGWVIILETGEFAARLGVWEREISYVKIYNLSEYPYSPAQKAEVAEIRISFATKRGNASCQPPNKLFKPLS